MFDIDGTHQNNKEHRIGNYSVISFPENTQTGRFSGHEALHTNFLVDSSLTITHRNDGDRLRTSREKSTLYVPNINIQNMT